ncbi:hypothetical protein ACIBO2_01410 [Nonomuraea sp. NPDC050022]
MQRLPTVCACGDRGASGGMPRQLSTTYPPARRAWRWFVGIGRK